MKSPSQLVFSIADQRGFCADRIESYLNDINNNRDLKVIKDAAVTRIDRA